MTETPMPPAIATLAAERPYFAVLAELLADAGALLQMVERERPNTRALSGPFVLTIDYAAATLLVGKQITAGRVAIVERIRVDPQDSTTFGVSDLPVVEPDFGRLQ